MKLALMGDLHLANNIYSSIPQMTGDSAYSLQQITEYCRKEDCPLLLLGDNFDSQQPPAHMVYTFKLFTRGLKLGYIVGQHDRQRCAIQWPACADSSFVHLNQRLCNTFGFSIYGLDWQPRGSMDEALAKVPAECEILVLHQLLKQCISYGEGDNKSWDLDAATLPASVKHTFLGDWHGLPNEGVSEGRKWAYTGSSCSQSSSEPVDKSFIVCKRSGNEIVYERVPLVTRPYAKLELFYDKEIDDYSVSINDAITAAYDKATTAGCPTAVAKPLLVIKYSVNIEDAYKRIMEPIKKELETGMAYIHLQPVQAGSYDDNVSVIREDAAELSVKDVITELVDPELAPELHSFVTEIAMERNTEQIIKKLHTKYDVTLDSSRL